MNGPFGGLSLIYFFANIGILYEETIGVLTRGDTMNNTRENDDILTKGLDSVVGTGLVSSGIKAGGIIGALLSAFKLTTGFLGFLVPAGLIVSTAIHGGVYGAIVGAGVGFVLYLVYKMARRMTRMGG